MSRTNSVTSSVLSINIDNSDINRIHIQVSDKNVAFGIDFVVFIWPQTCNSGILQKWLTTDFNSIHTILAGDSRLRLLTKNYF